MRRDADRDYDAVEVPAVGGGCRWPAIRLVDQMAEIMDVPTDVGMESGSGPGAFQVEQNYPNPFNASTQIHYDLARSGEVEVAVYNARGQAEQVIASGWQEAGAH